MERSESIGQLAAALSKAQKSYKPLKKEAYNPYFNSKYADLAAIIEATSDSLCDNELSVIQLPSFKNGKVTVNTMLLHSSGEFISEELPIPVPHQKDKDTGEIREKDDPQSISICTSYARRIAQQAILNVSGEDDTDGNAVSGKSQPPPKPLPKVNQKPAEPKNTPRPKDEPIQKTDGLPTKEEQTKINETVREWMQKVDKEKLGAYVRRIGENQDVKKIAKDKWNLIFANLTAAEAQGLESLEKLVAGENNE